jgi:asparagine synthase (glutamine-hydrolysing)
MCGFAVAIGWPEAAATVASLIDGIQHRGDITDPLFTPFADVAMCTRRLRIVDAEHGTQPQISFYGRLAVSFNGEIYNHVELREELEALGVGFRTHSDTEVLANALQAWGFRALERLNGMYAFVAVDLTNGEFLAARDPFGVKPLYVMQQGQGRGQGFLFCSEMKPLLDTVPVGDVMMLPPGFALSRKNCARYRSPVFPRIDAPVENSPAALDAILRGAVERRIPPGLPVATWFSGGIDSTLVAHYTREFRPEAPGYFVGGEGAPDYRYAEAYAEKTGYDLRIVPFEPESDETFASIDDVVLATESFEPNLIRSALASLKASIAMQRDGFRVGLCGEGADELFCGYAPLEIAFHDSPADGVVFRDECLSLMHRVSLQRVDRASMRQSLEMREPFLDPAVVNYALGLAPAALVRDVGGLPTGKMPLRELYDLYPEQLSAMIRDRSKIAFGEGAGLETGKDGWARRFEDEISDADFRDGQRQFDGFRVQSKEELYYLRKLAGFIDVARVPYLKDRAWISFPVKEHLEKLKVYAHFSL